MTEALDPTTAAGRTAVDPDGNKIGKIEQIYLDDQTGQPSWVTVSTGLFGSRESFAPLYNARTSGDEVVLGVPKDKVKDAPNVENDGHLSPEEERALYDYYAGYTDPAGGEYQWGTVSETGTAGGADRDVSSHNTDDAMTRSEEQVRVGTENVETGRARLRKYVVTENVQQTVPVSHEELRVEREPITEGNVGDATEGPAISEAEHEVTLHSERPVVQKEAVPVERVRLDTDTVTEHETVDEEVRKEQIDTDVEGRSS